jgi:hypothetical protein
VHPSRSSLYDLMAPRLKNLCACGCGLHVTRYIEIGHLNGRRSALLAADVLSQNRLLLHSRKRASSKLQLMLPSRHSRKQELIGRPLPAHQALSKKTSWASWPDRLLSENPLSKTGEAFLEYDDLPASEAGPSGVCHETPFPASPHTVDLDESLSARCSPAPVTQDPPPPRSSPMPLLPNTDGGHQYGLSTARRSRRITERVERIGRVRWGTNHVQFIEREEREEEEEEEEDEVAIIAEENSNMEDEEDGMGHDDDELEDEEDMPFAEPGQEGISVWDLLGEGFWKEVAELGLYFSKRTNSKWLSYISFRRQNSR